MTSVAELKSDGSGYSYVFTYANYWFKNKTTFYGDWIVLPPEGASNLSDYYRLVAYGVKWLSQNVYNGASPGYFTRGKNSGYVPQAYPQIANALETLASNIPAEINLPVEKGYALITDVIPLAIVKSAVISGIINAVTNVLVFYAMGERDFRKLALDAAVGFVSGFVGTFTGGLLFGLNPKGIDAVAKYI